MLSHAERVNPPMAGAPDAYTTPTRRLWKGFCGASLQHAKQNRTRGAAIETIKPVILIDNSWRAIVPCR